MKEGASVLGAELTESVAVSPLESDVYVSFIISIQTFLRTQTSFVYGPLAARRLRLTFFSSGKVLLLT